jgi:hypothetical protein
MLGEHGSRPLRTSATPLPATMRALCSAVVHRDIEDLPFFFSSFLLFPQPSSQRLLFLPHSLARPDVDACSELAP